jgi:hypothetical protein
MVNDRLDSAAKSLQELLKSKNADSLVVGWSKDSSGNSELIIHLDLPTKLRPKDVPKQYMGYSTKVELPNQPEG